MGLIGCPDISLTNNKSTLCDIPEQQRPHLHHSINLKSRNLPSLRITINSLKQINIQSFGKHH